MITHCFIEFFVKNISKITLVVFSILIILFVVKDGFFIVKNHNTVIEKNSELILKNTYSSYVINLDQDTHKLAHVTTVLERENIPFERLSGIYAKTLSQEYLESVADKNAFESFHGMPIKAGTIGCYLSHVEAWKKFLATSNEFAVIMEDDIEFRKEYHGQIKQLIENVMKNKDYWDILSFELSHEGMPLEVKKIDNVFSVKYYLTHVSHSGMYMINRKAAVALLSGALPMKLNLDHYLTRTWDMNGKIRFAGIEPRVGYQKDFESSRRTIDKSDKVQKQCIIQKIKLRISRSVFVVKTSIIYFATNLKNYLFAFNNIHTDI